jgi:2-polyprenyl-3-methyl-5-hydroxy-6-metoxy-1,4-benzoquinol methylase
MPNYGNAKYWNKRYSKNQGDTFDWLEDFNSLKDAIYENVELVRKASNNLLYMPKILNLGCGNSVVAEAMYDSGLTNIFNIDISPVCIEAMQ